MYDYLYGWLRPSRAAKIYALAHYSAQLDADDGAPAFVGLGKIETIRWLNPSHDNPDAVVSMGTFGGVSAKATTRAKAVAPRRRDAAHARSTR
jgi:nucleoside phosphorylase